MTVPALPRKAGPYLGTGSVSVYSFAFPVVSASHIEVHRADVIGSETVLVQDADYYVALNRDQASMPGGTITLINGPLPSGYRLTILSAVPYAQTTDIPAGGNLDETTIESTFDTLEMQIQQLAEQAARALQVPPTSSSSGEQFVNGIFDAADLAAESASIAVSAAAVASLTVKSLSALKALTAGTPQTVYMTGRVGAGDGGQGVFQWFAGDQSANVSADPLGGVWVAPSAAPGGESGAWRRLIQGTRVNVRWWGAVGDGAVDDSQAIIAMRNWVLSQRRPAYNLYSSQQLQYTQYLPAGTYLVTADQALLPSTYTVKSSGYVLEGDDFGQTAILFKPPGGNGTLCYNNNALLHSLVRNVRLESDSNTNKFMHSVSVQPQGAVQGWTFERVLWNGAWGVGVELHGNNNNSEFLWEDCRVGGEMTRFLYVPPSDGTLSATDTSDQFLNYWFENIKFWPTSANPNTFCEMHMGGTIRISNSDFSGIQNGQLFRLMGGSHARGVCSFSCYGVRFELKSPLVSVMYSEWPQGNISFTDCDWSSQASAYGEAVAFEFKNANVAGATIAFDRCTIIGRIRFAHETNDFRYKKSVKFSDCVFLTFHDVFDAFDFVSSTNDAGHSPVAIERCRGGSVSLNSYSAWAPLTAYAAGDMRRNNDSVYEVTAAGVSGSSGGPRGKGTGIIDGSVTWKWIYNASRTYLNDTVIHRKTHRNPEGLKHRVALLTNQLPMNGASNEVILPPRAIVVSARLLSPAGAVTSAAPAEYTIQTDQPTPTVFIYNNTPNASNGFDATWSGFFDVGDDLGARCIKIQAGDVVDQFNSNAYAIIEYIA